MLRRIIAYSGSAGAVVFATLLIIFSEGILIFSINEIGIVGSIIIFFIISFPLCFIIHWVYETNLNKEGWVQRLDSWVRNREKKISMRWIKIAKTSKSIALILSSFITGVFTTTIFIELLGFRKKIAVILIIINVLFFYTTWSLIYSGALRVVSNLL